MRTLPIVCCLMLVARTGAVSAQTTGNNTGSKNAGGKAAGGSQTLPPAQPAHFPELFPNPTHMNGYEEFVQAGDLIQNIAEVDTAALPDATLSAKRKLLTNPAVIQALHLIREGLDKPVASPRKTIEMDTRFPELSGFRKLGRLLMTEQYVAFAEGRVDAAIDSLQVGLAFGYRIQIDSITGGLSGLVVDTFVMSTFGQHLDQLSVYNCDRVSRLVEEFLNAENPAIHLIAQYKAFQIKKLESQRKDPQALLAMLDDLSIVDDPVQAANYRDLYLRIANHPQGQNATLDEAENYINAQFDQALRNLSLPPAECKPFAKGNSDTPGALLANTIASDPSRLQDVYSDDQAKLRLLGLHALIHRYRWDHNALPTSLSELHAEKLITDPFTGDQIIYKRQDDHYTLYSVGPFQRDESGQVTKVRTPVDLSPEK